MHGACVCASKSVNFYEIFGQLKSANVRGYGLMEKWNWRLCNVVNADIEYWRKKREREGERESQINEQKHVCVCIVMVFANKSVIMKWKECEHINKSSPNEQRILRSMSILRRVPVYMWCVGAVNMCRHATLPGLKCRFIHHYALNVFNCMHRYIRSRKR